MAPKEFVYVVVDEEGTPTEAFKTDKAAKDAAGEGEVVKLELKAAPAATKATKRAAPKESADKADAPAQKKPKAKKSDGESVPEGKDGALDGLNILFTGSMELSRKTMETTAETYGATIVKKLEETDYIVLGLKPGDKKIKEIEEKGLKTITVEEFMEFIKTGEAPE